MYEYTVHTYVYSTRKNKLMANQPKEAHGKGVRVYVRTGATSITPPPDDFHPFAVGKMGKINKEKSSIFECEVSHRIGVRLAPSLYSVYRSTRRTNGDDADDDGSDEITTNTWSDEQNGRRAPSIRALDFVSINFGFHSQLLRGIHPNRCQNENMHKTWICAIDSLCRAIVLTSTCQCTTLRKKCKFLLRDYIILNGIRKQNQRSLRPCSCLPFKLIDLTRFTWNIHLTRKRQIVGNYASIRSVITFASLVP